MRLVHVNLVVADPDASARFYARVLMPDAVSQWMGDSLHLRDTTSDLAFQRGGASAAAGAHHGFVAGSAAAVDEVVRRLAAEGIALTEDWSDSRFRSIKFCDPDGYACEVYWEARWP